MPIHVPGKRDRRGRQSGGKRSVVAVLQLTAMVDMFTVLAVFLLQNYNITGQAINIPKGVSLPDAANVKEAAPSNVVILSKDEVQINNEVVAEYNAVKEQSDWMISSLSQKVINIIKEGEADKRTLGKRIQNAIKDTSQETVKDEVDDFRTMNLQVDKDIDFLTVKKVMYTLHESGIYEINFAVIKSEKKGSAKN